MAFEQLKNKLGTILGYVQTDNYERLGVHNLLHVQERTYSGASAGTFTSGAWRTRNINTVVINNLNGSTLNTGILTLPSGRYIAEFTAAAIKVDNHSAKLHKISPLPEDLIIGTIECSSNADYTQTSSYGFGDFILDSTSELSLSHIGLTTRLDFGLGLGSSLELPYNVFVDLKIWKVA